MRPVVGTHCRGGVGRILEDVIPGIRVATDDLLDFLFATPGARAVGMGKAFVGLADDATAAYSNPAGLSNLLAKAAPGQEEDEARKALAELALIAPDDPRVIEAFRDRGLKR